MDLDFGGCDASHSLVVGAVTFESCCEWGKLGGMQGWNPAVTIQLTSVGCCG